MEIRLAERAEMDAVTSATLLAPSNVSTELGLNLVIDEGVVMTLAAQADVLALNRIIGLGMEKPARREQIRRLANAAWERGVTRLFVQLAPGCEPSDVSEWVEEEGGTAYNRWVRLWRKTADFPEVPTDLRISRIDSTTAMRSGEIVAEAFGMPLSVAPWFASTVSRSGWLHYGAFDGDQLVATTAVYVNKAVAWLGFAATLAEYRGRGAQGALIRARVDAARELGCEWAVTETAEQKSDHSAPSYRNMVRYGFSEGYMRQNYLIVSPSSNRHRAT
jgi:hypothetical protein